MTDSPGTTGGKLAPAPKPKTELPSRLRWGLLALVIVAQVGLASFQLGDDMVRGHNGWNSAAYQLSARNTLRWDLLFPLQYNTGTREPDPMSVYSHAPLGLHLHTTASVWLFGDTPAATRLPSAIHGVLMVAMLFVFVRRFWGDYEALIASALYVAMPINAIYLNMVNHSGGAMFWSIFCVYAYLRYREERYTAGGEAKRRSRRWLLVTFGVYALALLWEFYANYIALGMAFHWFFASIRHRGDEGRWWFPPWRDVAPLAAWCVYVPALFAGHFLLVYIFQGTLDELFHTIGARANVSWENFWGHLKTVPGVVFAWPTLALAGLWLLGWFWRLVRGRAQARALVPVMFAIGGTSHYIIFKSSAIVHSYWAWPLLPFVSIALATMVVGLGGWLRRVALGRGLGAKAAALCALLSCVLVVPLVQRTIELVPDARSVGGSLWFVAPVRGPVHEVYDSGRTELNFAEQVRDWTDRETGVLVHHSIERMRPEPRFYTVLDRENRRVGAAPSPPPASDHVPAGWVFIAALDALPHSAWVRLAARHPYSQYGRYVMVDFRSEGSDVKIWELQEAPPSLLYSYFVTPFEAEMVGARAPEAESRLREQIRDLR